MTFTQLNSEIRAARNRLIAELDPFMVTLPPAHNAETARAVLSLLLKFEYRWAQKKERLECEHHEHLYGAPAPRKRIAS